MRLGEESRVCCVVGSTFHDGRHCHRGERCHGGAWPNGLSASDLLLVKRTKSAVAATPSDHRVALTTFIREAHKYGIRCVRVVHGKGLGSPGKAPVLKDKVHRWLVQKAEVVAFVQAQPAQGGAGAVVVLLQPVRRGHLPALGKNN